MRHLPSTRDGGVSSAPLGAHLEGAERAAIEAALEAVGGNRALAARTLGIHCTALYKKMAARRPSPGPPRRLSG